jgi:hypothetical protein
MWKSYGLPHFGHEETVLRIEDGLPEVTQWINVKPGADPVLIL